MLYVSRCMLHVVRCTLYVACCMVYVVAGAADEPEDPDHSAKIILGEASVFSKQSAMHMSHSPDEAVLVMVRTFHTVAATPPDTAGAVAVAVADGCSCNCAADAPIPPILCPDVAPAALQCLFCLSSWTIQPCVRRMCAHALPARAGLITDACTARGAVDADDFDALAASV